MRTRPILVVFAVVVLSAAVAVGALISRAPIAQPTSSTVSSCFSALSSSSAQNTSQGGAAEYAYQILVPCDAQMVASYYFPPNHPDGSTSLQAVIGPVTNTSSGWVYTACGSFNGTTNFCPGISVSASPSILRYDGGLNVSITYTISVLSTVRQGAYRLSLPGMQCSPIELVVGSTVPSIPSNLLSPFNVSSCLMAANFRPDVKIVRTMNLQPLDGTTGSGLNTSSFGRGFSDDYIVTGNASRYLPNGYFAQSVNLTLLRDGDIIKVGAISFRFEIPPTEIINGGMTTLMDYICPSFLHALFPNGSEFTFDYCTPMSQANRTSYITTTITTAGSVSIELSTTSIPWSMWELSRNTTPRVGVHVEGVGNQLTTIELIVAR